MVVRYETEDYGCSPRFCAACAAASVSAGLAFLALVWALVEVLS